MMSYLFRLLCIIQIACVLTTNGCYPPPPLKLANLTAELYRRGIAKCRNLDIMNHTVVRFGAGHHWLVADFFKGLLPFSHTDPDREGEDERVLGHSFINVAKLYDYHSRASFKIYAFENDSMIMEALTDDENLRNGYTCKHEFPKGDGEFLEGLQAFGIDYEPTLPSNQDICHFHMYCKDCMTRDTCVIQEYNTNRFLTRFGDVSKDWGPAIYARGSKEVYKKYERAVVDTMLWKVWFNVPTDGYVPAETSECNINVEHATFESKLIQTFTRMDSSSHKKTQELDESISFEVEGALKATTSLQFYDEWVKMDMSEMTKTVETSITARVPPGKRLIFKRLQARYGPFTFDSLKNMMYEEDCSPNHSTDLNLKTILIISLSATLMFV